MSCFSETFWIFPGRTSFRYLRRGLSIGAIAICFLTVVTTPAFAEEQTSRWSWQERDYLFGDWNGQRTRLEEAGFKVRSRLSQFLQSMPAGSGKNSTLYGGKVDFMVQTDLSKLGLWNGISLTAKAEYNFGNSLNGAGGTLVPVNTALLFPGINGSDRIDLSSLYLAQSFSGGAGSLVFGKINMIDASAGKRFAGGAGIDSFWNITYAAPPSGLVPAYLFGALLGYSTEAANYGFWIYDPVDCVNTSCLETPFSDGVTVRANVEFPVTIGGLQGHHGFAALYSNFKGNNLSNLGKGRLFSFAPGQPNDGLLLPEIVSTELGTKSDRYYFNYTFDQFLYQSPGNPEEGVGIFGQFGLSDGNPTRMVWSAHLGLGGTGLVPGRSKDTWGVGAFYDRWNNRLKGTVSQATTLQDEYGIEAFYNYQVAPWFQLGADLQVARPGSSKETATFLGLRSVVEF